MNTFNLFKQIDEELEEKIGLNISDYFLNYDTDIEKKEILNSVEPNTIQIMSDLDSSWTADYDNLTIKQTIKIENPSYLFGPDGVTLEKNKLGIGVHVHSRTSMFQETIAMAFTRDSLKQFGITDDEVITKILNAHHAELDPVKDKAEQYDKVKADFDEQTKSIEGLKASVGDKPF